MVPVGVRMTVVVGDDAFAVSAVPVALESVVPQQGTGFLRSQRARNVQHETKASRVEAGTECISWVEGTRQQRNGFHGPVETEPSGTQQKPKVESR